MIEQGVDQIVDSWSKHAAERITAAFLPTVESAYALAAEFVGRGIAAEVVVGETKRPVRDAIYRRLAAGTTRVLFIWPVLEPFAPGKSTYLEGAPPAVS